MMRLSLVLLGCVDWLSRRMPWPLTAPQYRLCCVYQRLLDADVARLEKRLTGSS